MIVTFAHHKGGTGKTTSCVNVAGCAADAGKRVLVVDVDPQANATSGLGVDLATVGDSMIDVFLGHRRLSEILLETRSGVHLAPATLDLVGAEPHLYGLEEGRMTQLSDALAEVKDHYDLVLVDTPPGAGVLMLNGIAAADRVVVALDPGVFALEDLTAFETLIDDLKQHVGVSPRTEIGVVTRIVRPSWWNRLLGRSDPNQEVLEAVSKHFRVVHAIPYDLAVFESQRRGLPLAQAMPEAHSTRAYRRLTHDVTNHG